MATMPLHAQGFIHTTLRFPSKRLLVKCISSAAGNAQGILNSALGAVKAPYRAFTNPGFMTHAPAVLLLTPTLQNLRTCLTFDPISLLYN